MPTFIKHKPSSEKELHSIIAKELDAIEDGLELLKYEMGFSQGIPDFLCVDSGGRLVIIEVKLYEDQNVIFQALRYYNFIDPDRYKIAKMFPQKNIDPGLDPRIVIIAGSFSDDLRLMATRLKPEIELFEYCVLKVAGNKLGLYLHPVSLPQTEQTTSKPLNFEDHFNYITNEELKKMAQKVHKEILQLKPNIDAYPRQSAISYHFKGRQIGWLYRTRKAFDVGAVIVDENGGVMDYQATRIENGDEYYPSILNKMIETYTIIDKIK